MSSRAPPAATIDCRIFTLRDLKVLLDADLAELYGVSTKSLLQAGRRNPERFPSDFAFILSKQELAGLRSQIVTSKVAGRGGRRYLPAAFTEQGVAMLSSVLRSPQAVAVNVEIMRAFVRLRRAALVSEQIIGLVSELARRIDGHDEALKAIVETIQRLVSAPPRRSRPIGFVPID